MIRSASCKIISVFLAVCFINLPVSSKSEPLAPSPAPRPAASSTQSRESLLDPDRVPEGAVIEYGQRIYWRDPATRQVFWAQKDFLEALFLEKVKQQSESKPMANAPSASAAPLDRGPPRPPAVSDRAPVCRADLSGLDADKLIKSAAQIQSSVGVCGGARVSADLVITNGHCVIGPRGGWAEARAIRGRDSHMRARFIVNGQAHSVHCGTVMAISPFQTARDGRDFAVVRCSGIPADVPVMRITETEPLVHASIAIATWDWPRRGVPSRVSVGRVLGNDHSYLIAQLKIMDGNSGSMIVNANQEICGVANGVGEGPVAGKAFFHSMKEIMRQVREQSSQTYAEIMEATKASAPRCVAEIETTMRAAN